MNIFPDLQQIRFLPLAIKRTPAAEANRGPNGGGLRRSYFTRSMNVRSTVFTRIFSPDSM